MTFQEFDPNTNQSNPIEVDPATINMLVESTVSNELHKKQPIVTLHLHTGEMLRVMDNHRTVASEIMEKSLQQLELSRGHQPE